MDGSVRTCTDCGESYNLPIPYEQANPLIRDLCLPCIKKMQRDYEVEMEKKQGRPDSEGWF